MMMLRMIAAVLVGVALMAGTAFAEEDNPAALAKAMSDAKTRSKTASCIYAAKDKDFFEVVLDPATAAIVKTEKITGGDDLKDANTQSASLATATQSLRSATEAVVNANAGFRAVSVVPDLKDGRSVAVVTLSHGTNFKTVTMPLR